MAQSRRTAKTTLVVAGTAVATIVAMAAPAAAAGHPSATRSAPAVVKHAGPVSHAAKLPKARLQQVQARTAKMAATHHSRAPLFKAASSKSFTVNTTEDSGLLNSSGKTCVDASSGKCSLRAAVEAANNIGTAVKVTLGAHTYTLSTGALSVTDPGGLSLVGAGSSKTKINGNSQQIINEVRVTGKASPELFLTALTLTGGSASDGGAMQIGASGSPATAVLDHVLVTDNTASSEGGGIYAPDGATLYLTNSTISHNKATYGAGIYAYWLDGQFTKSSITHNTASIDGGGLYTEFGVYDISGDSISDNTAGTSTTAGYGGGIFDDGYTIFTLTQNVRLNGNTTLHSGDGGAFYGDYDSFDMTGGEMSDNTAKGGSDTVGGGMFMYGGQAGFHHVTMTHDLAQGTEGEEYGGGAIYSEGYDYGSSLVIDSKSKITKSNATAVFLYSEYGALDVTISHSTLSGNSDSQLNGDGGSVGCGGAVCAFAYYGGVTLLMDHNTVSSNTGTGTDAPGAVGLDGDYYGGVDANLDHNTFAHNSTGAGGEGGAVGAYNYDEYSPVSLETTGDHFTANSAGKSATSSEGYGGALSIYYYAVWTDHGSTFSGNQAKGTGAYGGAVYEGSYQSARLTGTRFTGNTAGASSGYGGAYYTDDEAGDLFSGVVMSGNSALSGGGLYADDDAYGIEINRSTISGNTAGTSKAAGYGGGIYFGDATASITNSTISGNRALASGSSKGYGGGIYVSDYITDLRYSTVSNNDAAAGGGIYEDGFGGSLLATIVSGNHAKKGGKTQNCTVGRAGAALNSVGGNVIGLAKCVASPRSNDKVTTKPGLKSLQSNGGHTQTMALTSSSPAIDRGGYDCPSTDQRGVARNAKHCDSGAYQHTAKKKKKK